MDLFTNAAFQAIGNLLRVGAGALIWLVARHFAKEYEPISRGHPLLAYGRVALACAVLGLASWTGYGTHVEDADPMFGGGEVVEDFEPTPAERDIHGIATFLTTLAIAGYGTWRGRNQRRTF